MEKNNIVPVFSENESFFGNRFSDFYIGSYQDEEPDVQKRVRPHRHTYYEIIWVRYGKGSHTIDFVDYKFNGPCLFLLHPQNIHTIKKQKTTGGGVIKFAPSFIDSEARDCRFLFQYGVFDDTDVLPVINLNKPEASDIHNLFIQLLKEYRRIGSFAREICISYFKIFLFSIYEIKKRSTAAHPIMRSDFDRFRKFQNAIENNFSKEHNIKFYSDILSISIRTLGNITQKYAGKTPLQLINDRVILEAKRLLYHSNLTINEIAYSIGFHDPSYFMRFFKKKTALTPKAFRLISQ